MISSTALGLWFAGVVGFILIDLMVLAAVRLVRAAKYLEAHAARLAELPPGIDPARTTASLDRLKRCSVQTGLLRERMDAAMAILRAGPRIRIADLPPVVASFLDDLARLRAR